jgi:hypothetical protein
MVDIQKLLFKITKVFKNEINNGNIFNNGKISVFESTFTDPAEKKTYSINGYEKMRNGKEYLLFLIPLENDNQFSTRGVTYGKIPLDTKELEVFDDTQKQVLSTIFSEAREKYSGY